MQEAKQKKGASTLDKINFVLMGISSLIGWSAVCNSFGYFIDKFSKVNGNIPFVFPIPQMFANFFFGLLMPFLVKYSDKTRIVISLFGLGVALTLLPVIGMIQGGAGLGLCLLFTFMIGMFNAIAQNTMIALAAGAGGELCGLYWVATGISGLTMDGFYAIALLIFPNSLLSQTFFLYVAADLIMVGTIFTFFQYQKQKVSDNGSISNLEYSQAISNLEYSQGLIEEEKGQEVQVETQQLGYFQKIAQAAKVGGIYPLLVWIVYVQTFILFPGVTQLGDIFGKFIGSIQNIWKPMAFQIGVLVRFVFFVTSIFIVEYNLSDFWQSDAVCIINMFLFAATNGFCTAGLMSLGPAKAKDGATRDLISFISAFALTFGISCGTFLALPLQTLPKKD